MDYCMMNNIGDVKEEPMSIDRPVDDEEQNQNQTQEQQHAQMQQQQTTTQPLQQQQQQDSVPLQQQPLNDNDQHASQSSNQEPHNDTQKGPAPSSTAYTGSASILTKGNILEAIKDFDPSIPDPVVHHFLNIAGMQTSDQRIIRLIAIASQKFIHDIVSDSLQHCKLRGAQNKKTKEKKYTLSIDDLTSALAEYGIEVKRQHYFN